MPTLPRYFVAPVQSPTPSFVILDRTTGQPACPPTTDRRAAENRAAKLNGLERLRERVGPVPLLKLFNPEDTL